MNKGALSHAASICLILSMSSVSAWADDNNKQPPTDPATTASPSPPSLLPSMTGPLVTNPKPMSYDVGPLGPVYITGVASGYAQWQNHVVPGDRSQQADISNAQIFLNKPDGLVQFFAQVGAYSLPDIGLPYIGAGRATNAFYGPFPQGFLKIAPTDNFSIEAGKLPTLIGAEYTRSFENMNIERGLLWNQENAVNRGVQANYTLGPVALSASWNDGMYSNRYSWAWLSATWSIDSANPLAAIGGGNTRHTNVSTTATPLFQNNEQIYNLIYTHTAAPWTFEGYYQHTHVPKIPTIGALHDASTDGIGLYANYSFTADTNIAGISLAGFSLPVRVEYITSSGSVSNGAPNLIYGPGSSAWSVTVTPTYQYNVLFVRPEFSFVGAMHTTAGSAFGPRGTDKTQARLVLETGVIF